MLASSVGGPHLPDPGPDATVERQKLAMVDRRVAKREHEIAMMVAQVRDIPPPPPYLLWMPLAYIWGV